MQKVMLFLASMLIVFSLSSCSKDDDSTITISPKEVTMKVDEKSNFKQHLSIFTFFYHKKRMILRRNSYLCNIIIKSHKYANKQECSTEI